MPDSRLSRRNSKQGKKQLYLSLGGIIVLIFIALNFGPLLIAASGNFIDGLVGKTSESSIIIDDADLLPPELDPLPQSVSEQKINVSGNSFYTDGRIELYLNGLKYDSVTINDSQSFEFKNVSLKTGKNSFKTKFINDDKESEFSEDITVSYIKDAPQLELVFPEDGQSFKKGDQEISVNGSTNSDNTVRVNGFISIVNADGEFTYLLKLSDGENKIKIEVENLAGKSTEKEITVSYSP